MQGTYMQQLLPVLLAHLLVAIVQDEPDGCSKHV